MNLSGGMSRNRSLAFRLSGSTPCIEMPAVFPLLLRGGRRAGAHQSGGTAAALPGRALRARDGAGDFHVDLENRDVLAVLHPDVDLLGSDVDVARDHGEDLLAQHPDQSQL